MRIIAFITHSAEIRHILNHIGVESAKLLPLSGKRALNLPWPNVFRGPKLVPYLASCG